MMGLDHYRTQFPEKSRWNIFAADVYHSFGNGVDKIELRGVSDKEIDAITQALKTPRLKKEYKVQTQIVESVGEQSRSGFATSTDRISGLDIILVSGGKKR